MDRISVIVPAYNRKAMLQRLLESFSRLESHLPLEFIIVDDCSEDSIREVVEDWKNTTGFIDVKYHRLASRSGPALARNAGILLSTGNILAFTDSDCIVDPSWVEQLYGRLCSDPVYAGTGGRVLPVNDDIYSLYNTAFRILEPPGHINTVIGANCMFWKQPVVDAGMFDDFFSHPGGEEIALSMKLWIKGYRFGFEEKAVVHHDYRQTLADFIRTFYIYGTGERILFEKRLKEYLQYMKYPEEIYHYLAFRNFVLFELVFLMRVIYGILRQWTFVRSLHVSNNKRLMLISLNAIQNFCYHYGRGTFSGAIVRTVRKYGPGTPDTLVFP